MPLTKINPDVISNIANLTVAGNITTYGYYLGDGGLLTNIGNIQVTTVGNLTSLNISGITTAYGNILAVSGARSTSTITGAIQVTGSGGLGVNGNVVTTAIYTDQYFYSNGTPFSGYAGSDIPTNFETLNKNLKVYPYTINYQGRLFANIVYTISGLPNLVKAFSYSNSQISGISISGGMLGTKILFKNLSYSGTTITGASYSQTS